MEEIEILKERLAKAIETFKKMKIELEEKDRKIDELNAIIEEMRVSKDRAENDFAASMTDQAKMTSKIKKLNQELEEVFNIFE